MSRTLKKEIWPHKVSVKQGPEKYEQWLLQNLGPTRAKWLAVGFGPRRTDYYFKDERDMIWFTLRWA